MHDPVTLVGVAMLVFAATNIDDLFLLLGFFADRRRPPAATAAGQTLGIAALYGVSVLASRLALALPPAYIGLLGLLPLALGVKQLFESREDGEESDAPPPRPGRLWALSVAAVTIANGGDNLGVYTPLFATLDAGGLALVGIVFLGMTAAWCFAAARLAAHPDWGAPIRRYAPGLTPWVLIGLGVFILYDSGLFAPLFR